MREKSIGFKNFKPMALADIMPLKEEMVKFFYDYNNNRISKFRLYL